MQPVLIAPGDNFRPLYLTMLALGGAAVLILAVGYLVLLRVAPPNEHTGLRATIEGVFAYDPADGSVHGGPQRSFASDQPFAARVDWAVLPASTVVGAEWYDGLGQTAGGVEPAPAGRLSAQDALVVQSARSQSRQNLPGVYSVVVARYSAGRAVELLARTSVRVARSG